MTNTLIEAQVCECDLHHEANHWLFNQWGHSTLLLGVILVVLGYLLFKKRRFLVDNLKWIAAILFLSGFLIYGYGFNEGGSQQNLIALAFRSALSSMEMFASHSDLLEIPKELHGDPWYMTIFSIIHFLAVIVSAIFIIKLLGFRFASWTRLFYMSIFNKSSCRLFVFWGVNDNSIALANSIRKERCKTIRKKGGNEMGTGGLKNCKFIFVRITSNEEKNSHGRFTFSHFFSSSQDGVERFIEKIEDIDGILVNSKLSINGHLIDKVKSEFDLYKCLGLKRLGRIIQNNPDATFYFLSQNEELNVEAVSVFKEIARTKDEKDKGVHDQIQIYCHARKNNQNMKLEMCDGLKHHIHIIDSSNLAILQLKKDFSNHPVSFVDVDSSEACARKPFTSMIIGFGETGRDAFRFLYEFSALINGNGEKNPQKIYVVDEHIDKLKGDFLMKAPALKDKSKDEIEWVENMSTHSEDFWAMLNKIMDRLNYVVIAIGNDNEGMSLAIDLYEYVYRYRKDCFDNFRIYLRINGSCNNIQLEQIKKYFDTYGKVKDVIRTFGTQEEVFSYEVISTDVLEKLAKNFYFEYQKIMVDKMPETNEEELKDKSQAKHELEATPEEAWDARRKKLRDRQNLESQIELSYKEEQDKANVWHMITKGHLAGIIGKDEATVQKNLNVIMEISKREKNTVIYPNACEGTSKKLFDNLSKCEHLRWNASMELQGFVVCIGERSYQRKEHPLIVDCKVLQEKFPETILYDNCVVELSVKLIYKQINDRQRSN
jgi:hypothetical protein